VDEGTFGCIYLCIGDSVAKGFCGGTEDTGLPNAGENIRAGTDASM